ncbi:MAG: HdaA/DnaA family protein [Paracraurococcus sp.]
MHGLALRGLPDWPTGPGLVLDDADCAPEEEALLHLLNLAAERGLALLLAGREAPARWPVALPDLRSRLRAMTAVAVLPPGDALLAALLRRHFLLRQLRVERVVQDWLLTRLPREAAAMAEAAARLDRAALAAGGRITRPLARAALAGMPGFGDGAAEEEVPGHADWPGTPTLL